jgi:D-tagatose-1,6-bisphosphate aldolase subunit GatZ/KbaZ
MKNPLQARLKKHRGDPQTGIYSVCSSNRFVLEAAMLQAKQDNSILLIESTSNQVDQYGGYSGMTPADFVFFVRKIAGRMHLPWARLILGGDHLGPNVWQNESAGSAMQKAQEQIRAYVAAGYSKIHLDTSMSLQGDPVTSSGSIAPELVAERAADLCKAAEKTWAAKRKHSAAPVYVIGSDVPVPGGAQHNVTHIEITSVKRVRETIALTHSAFNGHGLQDAWNRVIAVVVQPGVEFSDTAVIDYDHQAAIKLSKFISTTDPFLYEAHSTDFQLPSALAEMVSDHFAILKVGPWLTFAFREAVFALAYMEDESLRNKKNVTLSFIKNILDETMLNKPKYWQKHYTGDKSEQALARAYSYSDRVRYYWPEQTVQESLQRLFSNLKKDPPPLNLVSQYFPDQYWKIRERLLENDPVQIIYDCVRTVLKYYSRAAGMSQK